MKQGINIIQLTKYLESKYENVNVKSDETCGYVFYVAYFKDGEDNRALFVHLIDWEDEDGTYPVKPVKGTSVSLSLGYWGNSVEILTDILKNFAVVSFSQMTQCLMALAGSSLMQRTVNKHV